MTDDVSGMRNIKLLLEYDGTRFHGWQYQPGLRTVQGEIQRALKVIFNQEITVHGAGRTDAGVHARGQVANFLISNSMSVNTITAALNGNLPRDVRIIASEEAPENFHARFDAIKRAYSYTITTREKAIDRWYVWCYKAKMDLPRMNQAAQYLVGEHDFRAFCHVDQPLEHYRCFVEHIQLEQKDELIILTIVANRFLHHMVRIILGTLINVGRGFTAIEQIPVILESRDRSKAGPTVPAKGLCLERIYY